MSNRKNRVCPVELAGGLDSKIRRWFQNPAKILSPYIREGMTVMDFGCGPGFFTMEMARLVGRFGRVIAADLQEGMLDRLRKKVQGTEMGSRIILHKTEADKIGLSEKLDFILAFYMLHEIPDQAGFFKEAAGILNPQGRVFIVEPPLHASRSDFEKTLRFAEEAGFVVMARPKVLLSKTALLKKEG